jgi:hypothetical protein
LTTPALSACTASSAVEAATVGSKSGVFTSTW